MTDSPPDTYDSDPTLDALMADDPIPSPPYVNLDDLLLILTHLGDRLSVDGQRWLLRLLCDALEDDRKRLPVEWHQRFDDECDRWAAEDEAREWEAEQRELYHHAMSRDD